MEPITTQFGPESGTAPSPDREKSKERFIAAVSPLVVGTSDVSFIFIFMYFSSTKRPNKAIVLPRSVVSHVTISLIPRPASSWHDASESLSVRTAVRNKASSTHARSQNSCCSSSVSDFSNPKDPQSRVPEPAPARRTSGPAAAEPTGDQMDGRRTASGEKTGGCGINGVTGS
jgi:hypothetical protein